MKTNRIGRSTRKGFTLMELLLVLVILGVLAAVVVPKFVGSSKDAKITAAKAAIASFRTSLGAFELNAGRYPTTEEGLEALLVQPSGVSDWKGPYIEPTALKDPWGNPFMYRYPSQNDANSYDVVSWGPDMREGGGDDIDNWMN